jgi:energy-coupling factor transport system permease protein
MSADGRFLHRAAPPASLLLLGAFLALALSSRGLLVRGGALVLSFLLMLLSGESPRALLRRGRFLALFAVVLFLAQALFVRGGTPLLSLPRVTDQGLAAGAGMAVRFLLIVSSSLLFVLVADAGRLGAWIARSRIPYRYGFVVVLALRFVPFFRQELRAVGDAQRVRGIEASFRSPRGLLRAVRYTFLPVLVSGLSRADALAISMAGRGFGLHPRRTAPPREPLGWGDAVAVLLSLLLVGLTVASRWEAWP